MHTHVAPLSNLLIMIITGLQFAINDNLYVTANFATGKKDRTEFKIAHEISFICFIYILY